MSHELETTILGGLPVTIFFSVQSADPDVGIMSDYPENYQITDINGMKCPDDLAQMLWDFLPQSEKETLFDEMMEHANDRD